MKIVRVLYEHQAYWGALEMETVHVLEGEPYDAIVYSGKEISLTSCKLLAPVQPSKIVCAGKNYYDHAVEMGEGVPEAPVLFMKTPNTLANPEDEISAPDFVDRVDYEGELAVVIGKRAKAISAEHAQEYIFGYTVLNDVTARTIQKSDGQWTRGKCMDGFCPIGPWIETRLNTESLTVITRLNGCVVQEGNTAQLMTKIPELLAYITAGITLELGDVVATGTPAGIGAMAAGDVVEITVEGIGTLKNRRV